MNSIRERLVHAIESYLKAPSAINAAALNTMINAACGPAQDHFADVNKMVSPLPMPLQVTPSSTTVPAVSERPRRHARLVFSTCRLPLLLAASIPLALLDALCSFRETYEDISYEWRRASGGDQ